MDNLQSQQDSQQTFAVSSGIDFAVMLAFTTIDGACINHDLKRNLIYSALCFRSVFDNRMIESPDPIILKYNALSRPEPTKLELYDLVAKIVTLDNASLQLKAMWYLMLPYCVLMEAEHDETIFKTLVRTLHTNDVFDAVLKNRYSKNIPCTPEEIKASDLPDVVLVWYLPYLTYKNAPAEKAESDSNAMALIASGTRETAALKGMLALGDSAEVFARTERLLDCYPDNEEFMLLNLAARVALFKSDEKQNLLLMQDTLKTVDDYLTRNLNKEAFFMYYRGLTLLGLMDIEAAKKQFNECIKLNPGFKLAEFMLRAINDIILKNKH